MPVESANASKITGSGSVTATLDGSRLTITGTFQGMKSAATVAQLHMGARGVRGPVEFDLQIDKSPNGKINGVITLTKVQIDTLRRGWYYVQIHAEQAPEGTTQKAVRTRALIIGTGFSGLGMAIALQKQGVDFLILEKDPS